MAAETKDGRALHYVSRGSGTPTVVFEAGMGSSHRTWELVLPGVAARARAVAYDRSGIGASPPDSAPRTLQRAVDDLIDLLQHLGPGPFVLVGHSYGGPIVRSAATAIPDQIRGLVLVDQTDECCALYFEKSFMRRQRIMSAVLPLAARTALLRHGARRTAGSLPPDVAAELIRENSTPAAARASEAELEWLTKDLAALRDNPPAIPAYPVTLISGMRHGRADASKRAELIAAHEQRARGLPNSRHVRAEQSGHLVPFSEPELVTAEILRIIDNGQGPQ